MSVGVVHEPKSTRLQNTANALFTLKLRQHLDVFYIYCLVKNACLPAGILTYRAWLSHRNRTKIDFNKLMEKSGSRMPHNRRAQSQA